MAYTGERSDVVTEQRSRTLKLIDEYFEISKKGSDFKTELLAGLSTFLALSYIFVVNPAILSKAGIDPSVSLFATVVISAAATLTMGLWARLPFVVSTGMEMNAYVAFFAVVGLGFVWQQALGMVFWSSILMILLTVTSVREKIIDSIPDSLKVALSFSVGVFLVLIALSIGGILKYEGLTLKGFGSLVSPNALALYAGLALVLLFDRLKVIGGVLLSILITSGLYHLCQANGWLGFEPAGPSTGPSFSAHMFDGLFALDPTIILNPKAFSVILVLFVLDFYGSVAKFIGLTLNTPIMENGRLPRRTRGLLVDGVGTTGASILGTTSVVAYVESAVGIGMGARTGLTSVVCGLLMLACFVAFPLVQYVPVAATTGALAYVGAKLCPAKAQFMGFSVLEKVALASMPLITIATFAIDKAMLGGFAIFMIGSFIVGRRPNLFLIGSTLLLALSVALQIW
jgi:AGZA family xanthine/uracil permease-like MFS transporter